MDNEVSGSGNQYDYGFRIYNPRLGRFLSVDPLTRTYPWYTPYQFAGNMPLKFIDIEGLQPGERAFNAGLQLASPKAYELEQEIKQASANANGNKLVVGIFKSVFSHPLPKKLIEHYSSQNGQPYKLTSNDLVSLNVYKTGFHGGSEKDIKKAEAFLYQLSPGESKALPSDYSITGAAGNAGTLGRFRIELQGVITRSTSSGGGWTFDGQMRFTDTYDFKSNETDSDDIQRNEWGDFQTKFADKYLPGKPFPIFSDWINVKQDNADHFDWFQNKSTVDIPNRLGGSNTKETKETKSSVTSSGEIKKTD